MNNYGGKRRDNSETPKNGKDKIKEVYSQMRNINKNTEIPSDILGSYTGVDEDDGYPVQDADDL